MADIITNTLQIGSNNLILRDADAQEQLVTVKDGLTAIESDVTDLKEDISQVIDSAYVTDTASGAIASFNDGAAMPVKSLTVNIEPEQDLHGQNAPYPAGGGVNQWDEEWETGALNPSAGAPIDSTVQIRSKNFCECVGGATYYIKCVNYTDIYALAVYWYDDNQNFVLREYACGQSITAPTNAKYFKITTNSSGTVYGATYNHDISINYPSTDHNYHPYSNICPISGHTSAVMTRTGKNLVDISQFATQYPDYCSYSDGVLSVTAASVLYSTGISVFIPAGSTINWSITNGTATNAKMRFVFADGTVVSIASPIPFQTTKDVVGLRFDWSAGGTFTVNNFQAELGSTATAYEPYNGQTYTIDLDGTIYGGSLDVGTGVLTVDRGYYQWNAGASYCRLTGTKAYACDKSDVVTIDATNQGTLVGAICDTLPSGTWAQITNGSASIAGCVYGNGLAFRISGYTTATEYEAFLAEHPLTFVYMLKEPLTVQLTAEEATTLKGQNNIWADTGDVEVEYRADTKLYINKVLNG